MTIKLSATIPANYKAYQQPERFLWLAVVERALKDYCCFFDRLVGADQGDATLRAFDKYKYKGCKIGYNLKKVLREYDRLDWFLFCKQPKPFNLQYICEQLYDDDLDHAGAFRAEAKKLFAMHVKDTGASVSFATIVDYINRFGDQTAVKGAPLSKEGLRWKRYRLPNADS